MKKKTTVYDAFEIPSGGFLLIYYSTSGAVELIETSSKTGTENETQSISWTDDETLMGEPSAPPPQ